MHWNSINSPLKDSAWYCFKLHVGDPLVNNLLESRILEMERTWERTLYIWGAQKHTQIYYHSSRHQMFNVHLTKLKSGRWPGYVPSAVSQNLFPGLFPAFWLTSSSSILKASIPIKPTSISIAAAPPLTPLPPSFLYEDSCPWAHLDNWE